MSGNLLQLKPFASLGATDQTSSRVVIFHLPLQSGSPPARAAADTSSPITYSFRPKSPVRRPLACDFCFSRPVMWLQAVPYYDPVTHSVPRVFPPSDTAPNTPASDRPSRLAPLKLVKKPVTCQSFCPLGTLGDHLSHWLTPPSRLYTEHGFYSYA